MDDNFVRMQGLGADLMTMPCYFITGEFDLVKLMDPTGVDRMQAQLPNFRGATEIPGADHWMTPETEEDYAIPFGVADVTRVGTELP